MTEYPAAYSQGSPGQAPPSGAAQQTTAYSGSQYYDYDTTNPDSQPLPAPSTSAQQLTRKTSAPPPLNIAKFAGGTLGVIAAGAAAAALAAFVVNGLADGIGAPWARATFSPGDAAIIAVCASIVCAAAFLLVVWTTNSAGTLLSVYGWIAVAAAVVVPFFPLSQIMWPATILTAVAYGLVMTLITYLSRRIGIEALR